MRTLSTHQVNLMKYCLMVRYNFKNQLYDISHYIIWQYFFISSLKRHKSCKCRKKGWCFCRWHTMLSLNNRIPWPTFRRYTPIWAFFWLKTQSKKNRRIMAWQLEEPPGQALWLHLEEHPHEGPWCVAWRLRCVKSQLHWPIYSHKVKTPIMESQTTVWDRQSQSCQHVPVL